MTTTGFPSRRQFLKAAGIFSAAAIASDAIAAGSSTVSITGESFPARIKLDPEPRFDLSPYLYMQFMEPLGTTDGSVAAAWDFKQNRWREDLITVTRELAPSLIRWGGIFCSYYRWKEAVGPRDSRKAALNLLWGGLESNQVGTHEFVDFCRRVGADHPIWVNFESDGKAGLAVSPREGSRLGTPEEAREWVDYCNNPDNALRREHGVRDPYAVPLWQIGNETSYGRDGFTPETAARKTTEFARAMRAADPSIKLIGWGDVDWAKPMLEIAGDKLDFIAFHHMFNPDRDLKDSPLRGIEYRKDPARTWEHLMNAWKPHEEKILRMREETSGFDTPLALTECHFALPGRNRCEVLSTWAAGVANARLLNLHERHGDRLKIATLADFCGTRWQVNAVMIPVPGGESYMMPVALVMSLYRRHSGKKSLTVTSTPPSLDVTASRTGNRVYIHAVNTERGRSVAASLSIGNVPVKSGKIFELSADPEFEVFDMTWRELAVAEKVLPADNTWTFPPASVTAMELEI